MDSHRVRHPELYDVCPCSVQSKNRLLSGVQVGVACYYKGYESPPAEAFASLGLLKQYVRKTAYNGIASSTKGSCSYLPCSFSFAIFPLIEVVVIAAGAAQLQQRLPLFCGESSV